MAHQSRVRSNRIPSTEADQSARFVRCMGPIEPLRRPRRSGTEKLQRRDFGRRRHPAGIGRILSLGWGFAALMVSGAHAATIVVTSTASDRGTFTELQCLPPGSDVDAGPGATTVTGGATLATAQADGRVTLREAICIANNTAEADVVVLADATYTLSGADNYWYGPNGLPPIGDDITIEGNGAVIRRNPATTFRFRFFFVSRKTLTDGIAVRGGADRAQLTLRDLTLQGGLARGGRGLVGGGGGGMGGAIFNQGILELERVTFSGNAAIGGDSGNFFFGSQGGGGGMGRDLLDGGGFGPGLFGGGLGGSSLYNSSAAVATMKYGCGGGAGFGVAAGGDARTTTTTAGNSAVVGGVGGGLGSVGGDSEIPFSTSEGDSVPGGDGGAGAVSAFASTDGDGRGGQFGSDGGRATGCGGGGGVGGGGGPASLEFGDRGGAGGFGGGGGSRDWSVLEGWASYGGAGGFGGGSGAGRLQPGIPGFGGGPGGLLGNVGGQGPSGGGGGGLGGALFNHGGWVDAENTTWTANRAVGGSANPGLASAGSGFGGAIFNLDGVLEIRSSTLAGNRVATGEEGFGRDAAGGALYHRSQDPDVYQFLSLIRIYDTILADSLDGDGLPVSDCNLSIAGQSGGVDLTDSADNLVETLADPVGIHPPCVFDGPGDQTGDPLLGALGDHGGSTATMVPSVGSPVIDASSSGFGAAADQRGVARSMDGDGDFDGVPDIGAVEIVPVRVTSASVLEGSGGGSTPLEVAVSVGSTAIASSVELTASPGTATSGVDYVDPGTVLVTFAEGAAATQVVAIQVEADSLVEGDESLGLALSNAEGSVVVSGVPEAIILDDDVASLSIADASASESAGEITLLVTMSSESTVAVTFDVDSADGTAGDQATDGDFVSLSETVTLDPGEISAMVSVQLTSDDREEIDETFSVNLSAATSALAVAISDGHAVVTIEDDDDLGPPRVLRVDSPSREEVEECAQVADEIRRLEVVFDQAMRDPPGDTDPDDVTNPANYLLVSTGPDGDFSTLDCSGPGGDDVEHPIAALAWDGAGFVATVELMGELPDRIFQLHACEDLRDLAGNLLDGDSAGGPSEDFLRRFRVHAGNLFANAHFDSCGGATPDLASWAVEVTSPNVVDAAGVDHEDSPLSASARIDGVVDDPVRLRQCVAIEAGATYELAIRLRPTASLTDGFVAQLICDFGMALDCSGPSSPVGAPVEVFDEAAPDFVDLLARVEAPAGSVSASCGVDLSVVRDPTFEAEVDALFFGLPSAVFADGFESGDLSAWTVLGR